MIGNAYSVRCREILVLINTYSHHPNRLIYTPFQL